MTQCMFIMVILRFAFNCREGFSNSRHTLLSASVSVSSSIRKPFQIVLLEQGIVEMFFCETPCD